MPINDILNIGRHLMPTPASAESLQQSSERLLKDLRRVRLPEPAAIAAALKPLEDGLKHLSDAAGYGRMRHDLVALAKALEPHGMEGRLLKRIASADERHVDKLVAIASGPRANGAIIARLAQSPSAKVREKIERLIFPDGRGQRETPPVHPREPVRAPRPTPSVPGLLQRVVAAVAAPSIVPTPEGVALPLNPSAILKGAFAPDAVGMHGVNERMRKTLRKTAERMLAGTEGADRFMGFIANRAEAVDTEEGMHMPQAIAYMHAALGQAAESLTGRERQAVNHVLDAYKGFFASAVYNYHIRKQEAPEVVHLYNNALSMGMHAQGAGMIESGFHRHATVTRVGAVLPDEKDMSVVLNNYRKRAGRELVQLGCEEGALADAYHPDLTRQMVEHPSIAQFITASNCLVTRSSSPGHVTVTMRRAGNGQLVFQEVPGHRLAQDLRKLGLVAIGNGLKITLHNGGAGATRPGRFTDSFDKRFLVPLSKAPPFLADVMSATGKTASQHKQYLEQIADFDADSHKSRMGSPDVRSQRLGNCTVHSQKLALLYELSHSGDGVAGTPGATVLLSRREGEAVFAKMWGQVLQNTRALVLKQRGGVPLPKDIATAIEGELAWLQALQGGNVVKERRAAEAPRARIRPPTVSLDTFVQQILEPRRRPEPQAAAAAPAKLSLVTGASEEVPHLDPDIRAWYTNAYQKWWSPATVGEAVGFRLVMKEIARSILPHRRHALGDWIRSGNRLADAQRDLKAGTASPLQLRDALFAYLNDQELRTGEAPAELVRAWARAAPHDPLDNQLYGEFLALER